MAASANMLYLAIDYNNKANMTVAGTLMQPFKYSSSVGFCAAIVQWKISGGLTRTCFWKRVGHTCENDHEVNLDFF